MQKYSLAILHKNWKEKIVSRNVSYNVFFNFITISLRKVRRISSNPLTNFFSNEFLHRHDVPIITPPPNHKKGIKITWFFLFIRIKKYVYILQIIIILIVIESSSDKWFLNISKYLEKSKYFQILLKSHIHFSWKLSLLFKFHLSDLLNSFCWMSAK